MSAALYLTIRHASLDDAVELARLLSLLGHPTTAASVEQLWSQWTSAGNLVLVAARPDGSLAALASLHQMLVLHRAEPVGRITALVVDVAERGQGIGRTLVEAAEAHLAGAGCGLLEITSNAKLVDAHAFYQGLGYEATSIRLAKRLMRSH